MRYSLVVKDSIESMDIAKKLKDKIDGDYVEKNPDIAIAIGGDGTILEAVHRYKDSIIFGIHTGHLGFFANYSDNDVDVLINDINNNEYKVDYLDSLVAKFKYNGKEAEEFAINEFTIVSPQRTLRLSVSIDGEQFESFRGTGFCISTPYGSTAYNKSLDGSVIDPSLSTIQLTEIAAINSNSYKTLSSPLVLSSKRTIEFETKNDNVNISLTADHIYYDLKKFDSITIESKAKTIKMAYHHQESFLKRINRSFIISKD